MTNLSAPNLITPRLGRFAERLINTSVPLLAGVFVALVAANTNQEWYQAIVYSPLTELGLFGHELTMHFLVNDIFMTLFFGLAALEIVAASKPGGALYPPKRAVNPMLASLGGIAAPALVYLALIHGLFRNVPDHDVLMGAWAVPTATDIAIVWFVGRIVFGAGHPATHFLLLLAIVDDLIGLAVIALIYSDSLIVPRAASLMLIISGLAIAWFLHRTRIRSWLPYCAVGGGLVWLGLFDIGIHPSLALVPIVPFLHTPGKASNEGPYASHGANGFKQTMRPVVGAGLFFFGFTNAGIAIGEVMFVTWVVLVALVIGKTAGIIGFSMVSARLGYGLPTGMNTADLAIVGFIASTGLTVALFVSAQAFPNDSAYLQAARMGVLLSSGTAAVALLSHRFYHRHAQSPPQAGTRQRR